MVDNKFINYFVIFSFFGLWSSVGSDPYNFLYIFEKKNILDINIFNIDLKKLFNFFRASFPLFCLLGSLIIMVKFNLFKKQKRFIYLLLIIQLIQIFSTFFSKGTIVSNYEDLIDHIGRYHWIISSIALIFIFMISSKLNNFQTKILFYISSFFLLIMVLWFSAIFMIDFFRLNSITSIYNLDISRESAFFLNHEMPRVTGLSRSIVFLYIIIFYLFQDLNYKLTLLKYILLSILGGLIFLFQSKFAVITFLIVNFFFIFNFKKKIKGIIIIISLVIIQIILFLSISSSRIIYNNLKSEDITLKEVRENTLDEKKNSSLNNQLNNDKNENSKKHKHIRDFSDSSKSGFELFNHTVFSGRLSLWIKSLNYIFERPILGYGSMADRIILNKKQLKYNQMIHPISNAFLYTLISGGIFCFVLFLYFWINIREKVFNIFKFYIIENIYSKISTLLIVLIFLRCLVENSIMLFGVDFILLLNSMYLTSRK